MTFELKSKSRKRTTRLNRRSRRGGYVLVLVALLLFGLMAMAALVIDIGFARLAQRQMQTAADAAALEGLRFCDTLPPMSLPLSQDPDGARRQREEARRLQASTVVSQLFDDNLLADDADPLNFGAGPIVNFTGGAGDPSLEASQFIAIPDPPVYKPALVSNFVNGQPDDIRGDMVSGTFIQSTPGMTPEEIREHHLERSDYSRDDFSNNGASAFLVRLRRTSESIPPNVGTAGPSLPYLFGRGSLLNRQLIGEGIKVRATSIASAIPAVRVGPPVSSIPGVPPIEIPGILPIAIDVDNWNGTTANALSITSSVSQGLSIGEVISLGTSVVPADSGFCAIYQSMLPSNIYRVIGFGWIGVNAPASKIGGNIASCNATSRRSEAWHALGSLSDSDRDVIIDLNSSLAYPLLAPVLVR